MVIIQVAGGLGNQLQQYALYRKFVSMGVEARLDISWFQDVKNQKSVYAGRKLELSYFNGLVYETCTPAEKAELIGTDQIFGKLRRKLLPGTVKWFHETQMYHPQLLSLRDSYISGYFACEKYYGDILYDLRQKIQFPESENPLNRELSEEMSHCQSVSVHIRRGDYLDPENAAIFGNICTKAYYQSAMDRMNQERNDCHFYLFSDDVEYLKQTYIGEQYTIVDINHGSDSFFDIDLMSHCKHNICANSTFSFWGARLNDNPSKIMIRPTIHKNSQKFVEEEMKDYWQGWTFVNPEGRIY